jgi:hypothetical protein
MHPRTAAPATSGSFLIIFPAPWKLLVWLGFLHKTRAILFRTLLEERAVLDAPPR